MENLTLEHLAGYLPYGLKVKLRNKIINIHGLSSLYDRCISYDIDKKLNECEISLIKPILRPLSDLTKEIEVNGEKFVPIELFSEMFGSNDDTLFENMNDERSELHYSVCKDLPYYVIEWMLSLHFDIFGLIDKNLAIDINTL